MALESILHRFYTSKWGFHRRNSWECVHAGHENWEKWENILFCFVLFLFLRVRKKEIQKKCPSARVARSMFSTQKNARKSIILNSNDFMLITRKNSSINCFQYVSFLEHYLATLVFPSFALQVSRSEVFLIPPFLSSIIFTSVFFQGARVKLI